MALPMTAPHTVRMSRPTLPIHRCHRCRSTLSADGATAVTFSPPCSSDVEARAGDDGQPARAVPAAHTHTPAACRSSSAPRAASRGRTAAAGSFLPLAATTTHRGVSPLQTWLGSVSRGRGRHQVDSSLCSCLPDAGVSVGTV